MSDKYNYTDALELFKNAFDNGTTVTYKQLQEVFKLDSSIGDKNTSPATKSAIHALRNRVKEELGLTFKSAASGTHSGPEYHYYIVSKVKNTDITKKETVNDKIYKKSDEYEALSKNNQKLYMELEQEKAANAALLEKLIKLEEKEQEYKKIIQSLYRLLNI